MKKRGLSPIVSSVLLILVGISAILIIWYGIVPLINNNVYFDSSRYVEINVEGGYTFYDNDTGEFFVQVERTNEGEKEISKIKLIASSKGNSFEKIYDEIPTKNQLMVYHFSPLEYDFYPEKIKAVPVLIQGEKEKNGRASRNADVPLGYSAGVDGIEPIIP